MKMERSFYVTSVSSRLLSLADSLSICMYSINVMTIFINERRDGFSVSGVVRFADICNREMIQHFCKSEPVSSVIHGAILHYFY